MRWFRKKKPEPTGRVIDMTKTGWGHNISMSRDINDRGEWKAAIWVGNRPEVGDEIIWKNSAGIVKSLITSVEATRNVWDMSFIEGEITHLNDQRIAK